MIVTGEENYYEEDGKSEAVIYVRSIKLANNTYMYMNISLSAGNLTFLAQQQAEASSVYTNLYLCRKRHPSQNSV